MLGRPLCVYKIIPLLFLYFHTDDSDKILVGKKLLVEFYEVDTTAKRKLSSDSIVSTLMRFNCIFQSNVFDREILPSACRTH